MQEVFGSLLQAREASAARGSSGKSTRDAKKSWRTARGLGASRCTLHSLRSPTEQEDEPAKGGRSLDAQQTIRALGRLALQQETAIKVLRQDITSILVIQPRPLSTLQLLFQVGQIWEGESTERCHQPAPWQCTDHLPVRTPAQDPAGAHRPHSGERQEPRLTN